MCIFERNKVLHFPKIVQLLSVYTKIIFCIMTEFHEIVTLPVSFVSLIRYYQLSQQVVEDQDKKSSSSVLLFYSMIDSECVEYTVI